MNKRQAAKVAKRNASSLVRKAPESAIDSYSNQPARIGQFTGNQAGQGFYPLTRFTQQYMQLLAMYRSHWIVRKVVDVLAEDMLKDAPKLTCELKPKQVSKFDKVLRDTGTMEKLIMALKWGRLFGGGVAVICLEGHDDLMEPLLLEDVDIDSYRGLIALDRWAGVFPDPKLVTDMNFPKDFGLPESYTCSMNDAVVQVHHTRIIRFSGRPLPEWERQVEMYWGLSEIEVIFDELQKRDYASWNIVSLMSRASILSVKDEQLAQSMSGLGKSNAAFNNYLERMDAMAQSMNNQGLLVVGKDGGLEANTYSFGGIADIYNSQMADIAGAAEIPMSRLYGRTTSGLGTSGEGDLQIYYDLVETKRSREVNPAMDKLLPIVAMSTFGAIPDDFDYSFPPVRTMTNKERAELAKTTTEAVVSAYEADLITKKQAVSELAEASDSNGLFSNITDEEQAKVPDTYSSESGAGELDLPDGFNDLLPREDKNISKDKPKPSAKKKVATDSSAYVRPVNNGMPVQEVPHDSQMAMLFYHGLPIEIENYEGSFRRGLFWKNRMPADYGYIQGVTGADGDDLDCYVGLSPESNKVFVVDQNQFDGKTFDEHKIMLAYHSMESALEDYMAGHHKSKVVYRGITEMSMPMFRRWMATADLTKPCGE